MGIKCKGEREKESKEVRLKIGFKKLKGQKYSIKIEVGDAFLKEN